MARGVGQVRDAVPPVVAKAKSGGGSGGRVRGEEGLPGLLSLGELHLLDLGLVLELLLVLLKHLLRIYVEWG